MVAVKRPRHCLPKTQVSAKSQDAVWGLTPPSAGRLRKLVSRKMKLATEAPVNGGRNYNGPKVAKFLVG